MAYDGVKSTKFRGFCSQLDRAMAKIGQSVSSVDVNYEWQWTWLTGGKDFLHRIVWYSTMQYVMVNYASCGPDWCSFTYYILYGRVAHRCLDRMDTLILYHWEGQRIVKALASNRHLGLFISTASYGDLCRVGVVTMGALVLVTVCKWWTIITTFLSI